MSVMVSSAVLSAIISGLVTVLGYFVNYRNTGKQLENYKKLLEAKETSFEETIKLYRRANVITIDLASDELNSSTRCMGRLEPLRNEYNINEIFIPEEVSQNFKDFICDFNSYVEALETYEDEKRNGKSEEYTKHQEKVDNANNETDRLYKKVLNDFSDLRKAIKTKFTMFD